MSKILLIIFFFLSLFLAAYPVYADPPPRAAEPASIVNLNDIINNMGIKFKDTSTIGEIVTAALNYIYAFAGIGLLIYLIVAGFAYLTSAGDSKKLEVAKGKLTTALIGFIIVITAFWVTQIANYVFKLGATLN